MRPRSADLLDWAKTNIRQLNGKNNVYFYIVYVQRASVWGTGKIHWFLSIKAIYNGISDDGNNKIQQCSNIERNKYNKFYI